MQTQVFPERRSGIEREGVKSRREGECEGLRKSDDEEELITGLTLPFCILRQGR
jgi:hypothetical protein